jgi:hypothetical protein
MDGDERKVSTISETASTRSRATASSGNAADAPKHCAIYQLLGRAADDPNKDSRQTRQNDKTGA